MHYGEKKKQTQLRTDDYLKDNDSENCSSQQKKYQNVYGLPGLSYQKPRILPDKKLRTEFPVILFILRHTPNQLLKVPKDKVL